MDEYMILEWVNAFECKVNQWSNAPKLVLGNLILAWPNGKGGYPKTNTHGLNMTYKNTVPCKHDFHYYVRWLFQQLSHGD